MTDIFMAGGSSTTIGVRRVGTEADGIGSYPELLAEMTANYLGKPVLGPGVRPNTLDLAGSDITTEWTHTGTFTQKLGPTPYGLIYEASGGSTGKWVRPSRWRKITGGLCVFWQDIPGGVDFQYRADAASGWTNMGQPRLGDSKLKKFYVPGVTSSIEFRANNGAANGIARWWAIDPYYFDPFTTDGVIFHNVAITGHALGQMDDAAAGGFDGYAFVRGVVYPLTDPCPHHEPNAGSMTMNINDVNYADVPRWNTDLRGWNTAMGPLGPVMFINTWENTPANYNLADQTAYRAQMQTTAAALGVPIVDHHDLFAQIGLTDHAETLEAGFITVDRVHESNAAHILFATRIFWKMVQNGWLPAGPVPSRYPVGAVGTAKAYRAQGTRTNLQVRARLPLEVVPLKSPFTETAPPVFDRRIPQDQWAVGTTSASKSLFRTATPGSLLVISAAAIGVGLGGIATPSGYALAMDVGPTSGTLHDLALFWKIATGAETALTVSAPGATSTQAQYLEFYTLDHGVTVEATNGNFDTLGGSEADEFTGLVTTVDARDLIITAAGQSGSNGGPSAGGWNNATNLQAVPQVTNALMVGQYLPGRIGTSSNSLSDQAHWTTPRHGAALIVAFRPT